MRKIGLDPRSFAAISEESLYYPLVNSLTKLESELVAAKALLSYKFRKQQAIIDEAIAVEWKMHAGESWPAEVFPEEPPPPPAPVDGANAGKGGKDGAAAPSTP